MGTTDIFAVLGLLSYLVDVTAGTICTHAYIQSYYISGRIRYRKRYTDIYCSDSCCGDINSQYCCDFVQGQTTSVSEIVGIVIGTLTGCLVLLFFCVCVWLATSKQRRDNRQRTVPNVTHISGNLRRSTQGDISLPPTYEETVLGYDNNGFSPEWYSQPPSYNEVFSYETLKREQETDYFPENVPNVSNEQEICQQAIRNTDVYVNTSEISRDYTRSESVTSDSILLQYNRENDSIITDIMTSSNVDHVDSETERTSEVDENPVVTVTGPQSSIYSIG
ncbi:uncharacterized protein LOC133194716 [Saccostrea echinata]|uniref:uncharacterized protein LOC133194716 n=1 Tax=Saccostrea echinata TaxID=191078 RepID=UPI002A82A594|nr:uncharacterized protein LOC133194716 [Saccostrea echinata]